jgi:uncharacterized membrane protein YhaH (DUF805 family)
MAMWAFVLPIRLFMLLGGLTLQNIGFSPADWASSWMLLNISIGLMTVVCMWPVFVLMAKRLHDIGWSGWFAAPVFYPLAWGLGNSVYMAVTDDGIMRPGLIVGLILDGLIQYPLIASVILAIIPGQKNANRHGVPLDGLPNAAAQHF